METLTENHFDLWACLPCWVRPHVLAGVAGVIGDTEGGGGGGGEKK